MAMRSGTATFSSFGMGVFPIAEVVFLGFTPNTARLSFWPLDHSRQFDLRGTALQEFLRLVLSAINIYELAGFARFGVNPPGKACRLVEAVEAVVSRDAWVRCLDCSANCLA